MKAIYQHKLLNEVKSRFSDLLYFRNAKEISEEIRNVEINQILDGFEIVIKHMRNNAKPDEIKDLRLYASIFRAYGLMDDLEEELRNETK